MQKKEKSPGVRSGIRVDVYEELKGVRAGGGGGGVHGGCVRIIEASVKMKKSRGWGSSRGSGRGSGLMCTKN